MRRLAAPSFLLFVGVLAAYLSNGRTIRAGDTLPAAHLPWSLLQQKTFNFDEFPALYDAAARQVVPLLEGSRITSSTGTAITSRRTLREPAC